MSKFNYQNDCRPLFELLTEKQKEIIIRRFGLADGFPAPETLESIGQDLGLTRERIRQIVEAGLNKMRESKTSKETTRFFSVLRQYLAKHGGFRKEAMIFEDPLFNHQQKASSWLAFLLALDGKLARVNESRKNYAFWVIDQKTAALALKIIERIKKTLAKEQKPLNLSRLISRLGPVKHPEQLALAGALEISKEIGRTFDNSYGLKIWPEVSPRGVKDLARLILKKTKKPLHFKRVAELIDNFLSEHFLLQQKTPLVVTAAGAPASGKKTNFQTVHNELIKNPEFILVGRGLYALKEWGYRPGTVKEVVARVLKQSKTPLSSQEVLKQVLSQRQVKESTVLLNLGNKRYFLKTEDGRYALREA